MSGNNNLLSVDCSGEITYHGLNSHIKTKYKADTPLDKSFVPYLIMLFCAIVDASVFISLFKLISYDSPFMIGIEVAGCLWAFDVVPLYGGIQLRRIRQGLSRDRFLFWLAFGVFIVACVMNIILRIMTIDMMAPDFSSSSVNYFGTVTEASADAGVDSSAIALTIFGAILPLLTSAGSFFVSYLTYDPLKIRQRRLEEMLSEKKDEIRRLNAVLIEYDADEDYAENIIADDQGKFEEMKKMQRAMVINYVEYVRLRLKEHLADPTAISALSEEICVAILERLDCELAALDRVEIPNVHTEIDSKVKMMTSTSEATA